jgi:YjbR
LTPEKYRRLALSLPEAFEGFHMNHPDFRVNGKIFATLYKDNGVVILTPDQQDTFVKSYPAVFSPVTGGWGRRGATRVYLREADERSVKSALSMAWSNKNQSRRR